MKRSFEAGACALMLLGLLYFAAEPEELLAIALPAAVHELGHILALWLLGLRIKGIRLSVKGLCIEYFGCASQLGHALIALAGPLAGLGYALAVKAFPPGPYSDFLSLSAGVSILLSVFNLLPVIPLDGGRAFSHIASALIGDRRASELSALIGLGISLAFMLFGIWMLTEGRGAAALVASIWLLFYQESGLGIVKRREIL